MIKVPISGKAEEIRKEWENSRSLYDRVESLNLMTRVGDVGYTWVPPFRMYLAELLLPFNGYRVMITDEDYGKEYPTELNVNNMETKALLDSFRHIYYYGALNCENGELYYFDEFKEKRR